ncbi:class F sortase [Micromonospora sp. NPDC050397]|uniref:class F sortase n=1 Tax=Micromonospora sp. NPDC050397 TaxID=3364279 RepID=UPI00384EC70A
MARPSPSGRPEPTPRPTPGPRVGGRPAPPTSSAPATARPVSGPPGPPGWRGGDRGGTRSAGASRSTGTSRPAAGARSTVGARPATDGPSSRARRDRDHRPARWFWPEPRRYQPAPTPRAGRPAVRDRRRWVGPLAIVLVLVGVFATGAGLGRSGGSLWPTLASGEDRPPPHDFPVMEPSPPIRLKIDSIDVLAPVHRVGLADDGSIAVPALEKHNETGWYDRGPTPGQFGPSIIVGHADTRDGPSVFHDLAKLRPGARIEVTRQDRSVAVFEVNSVEHFDKSELPQERIYGSYERPALRLITCGGEWVGGSTGYADNIVAFASLTDTRDP